jgi:hypothetical protein
VLGWLFVGVLGIIWVVFLLPYGRWWSSPTSSVEEFERNMDALAETNGRTPGRWVLIPRKGARFVGPRDRSRMRAMRRRRQILAFLVELTLLTLVIGLFPPLHRMLIVPAVLGGVLFVYLIALMRIRTVEVERAQAARRRTLQQPAPAPRATPAMVVRDPRALVDGGLRTIPSPAIPSPMILEDDVHVVVHRSGEIDLEQLRAEAAAR